MIRRTAGGHETDDGAHILIAALEGQTLKNPWAMLQNQHAEELVNERLGDNADAGKIQNHAIGGLKSFLQFHA